MFCDPKLRKSNFVEEKSKNLDAILDFKTDQDYHLWYMIFVTKFVIYTKFHRQNHSFWKQFPKKKFYLHNPNIELYLKYYYYSIIVLGLPKSTKKADLTFRQKCIPWKNIHAHFHKIYFSLKRDEDCGSLEPKCEGPTFGINAPPIFLSFQKAIYFVK